MKLHIDIEHTSETESTIAIDLSMDSQTLEAALVGLILALPVHSRRQITGTLSATRSGVGYVSPDCLAGQLADRFAPLIRAGTTPLSHPEGLAV